MKALENPTNVAQAEPDEQDTLVAEACKFAKANNDDPNDHSVEEACKGQGQVSGLVDFLSKGK